MEYVNVLQDKIDELVELYKYVSNVYNNTCDEARKESLFDEMMDIQDQLRDCGAYNII